MAARGGAALVVARLARVARVVAMGWEAHELGGSTARAVVAGNVVGKAAMRQEELARVVA